MMGEVIYADFRTKSGEYTKVPEEAFEFLIDTAPCEMPPVQPSYTAPESDPA